MGSRVLRTLEALKIECAKNGLILPGVSALWKKEDFEVILRNHYWRLSHPDESMPEQVEVMLAHKLNDLEEKEQEEIWNSSSYTAEEKLDGCRIIMQINEKGSPRFFGRNKSVKTFLYDEKTDVLPFHSSRRFDTLENSIFDGELVSVNTKVDTGRTEINNALSAVSAILNSEPEVAKEFQLKYGPFKYVIFDVLTLNGNPVHHLPFSERRIIRDGIIDRIGLLSSVSPNLFEGITYSDINKKEFYTSLVKRGGEGIMLKDLKAPYEYGKRRWSLLKVKRFDEYDAFISGFAKSDEKAGFKDYIGALEFSVYNDKGASVVIGNVSAMPLEFRKWATLNPGLSCTLNPDLLGQVAVIRGQEFSSKNFRLKHCTFIPGMWEQPISSGNWLDYFRKDKKLDECIVNLESIIAKVNKGERT